MFPEGSWLPALATGVTLKGKLFRNQPWSHQPGECCGR